MPDSIAVFGYGSLLNRASAERTLRRPLRTEDMAPAVLSGFARVWRAKERVWFEDLGAQASGVFLDIERREGAWTNGVVFEVSAQELDHLKLREKNYDCVDVTAHIESRSSSQVYAFLSQDWARQGDPDVYVPQNYIQLVEQGCAEFGADFLVAYRRTTADNPFPVMRGPYRFADPVQAEFTGSGR